MTPHCGYVPLRRGSTNRRHSPAAQSSLAQAGGVVITFRKRRQATNRIAKRPVADQHLLDRWLLGEPACTPLTSIRLDEPAVVEAFSDLVEAANTDESHVPAALNRFGRRLALIGMLLEELSASIDRLVALAPNAQSLQTFSAGISLACGWSSGHLYGSPEADCVDALTGLSTLAMLRLRIEQVADQSAWLGVALEHHYCIAVIDADIGGDEILESELAMMAIAERLKVHYQAGETVARHGSRALVLTTNSERSRTVLIDVLADLRSLPLPSTTRVIGWIEEFTPELRDARKVMDFLSELTIG